MSQPEFEQHLHEFAGLRREIELGLAVAPTRSAAAAAAKSLAAFIDSRPGVPIRIAGLHADASRVRISLGITLGTVDSIKVADAPSRAAVLLIQEIVDGFAAYDPAFVQLPDPASTEARFADHIAAEGLELLVRAVDRLSAAV